MSDLEILLSALAKKETQGGSNNCPRFETSYIPKDLRFTVQGRVLTGTGTNVNSIVQERWNRWGLASAASYGPYQIHYQTAADRGFQGPPWDLWPEAGSHPWAVAEVLRQFKRGATTVEKMARAWNGGNPNAWVPPDYVADVKQFYKDAGGDPEAPLNL